MKKPELTCAGFILNKDGTTTNVDELSPIELQQFRQKNGERAAKSFQNHFSRHPEEWK